MNKESSVQDEELLDRVTEIIEGGITPLTPYQFGLYVQARSIARKVLREVAKYPRPVQVKFLDK